MRYYKIVISDIKSGTTKLTLDATNNPNALDVEMDAAVTLYGQPGTGMGNPYVRIWGVSLQQIAQISSNYNPIYISGVYTTKIEVYGGMQKGLPLANPGQSGLLVSGVVTQVFANWIETDQTLDIYFTGGLPNAVEPANLVLDWPAGTPLADALQTALANNAKAANYKVGSIAISDKLVMPNDEHHFAKSLSDLSTYLRAISQKIINKPDYPGINLTLTANTVQVSDGTYYTAPLQLNFTDLIGQPTWLDAGTISFMTVMRADIAPNTWVKLPPAQYTTTFASNSTFKNQVQFQGVFQVLQVRHVGRFRNPSGTQWCTVFQAGISQNALAAKNAPATATIGQPS